MHTKTKLTKKEADIYIDEYFKLSDHTINYEYLDKINLRAFFKEDNMIGGYCLNERAPFRYSMMLSETIFEDILHKNNIDKNNMIEVTGMWISRNANILEVIAMYIQLVKDAQKLNKKFLMGASTHKKIADYFQQVVPNLLYHGAPIGVPKFKEIWVYATTCSNLNARLYWQMPLHAPKMALKYFYRKLLPHQ